MTAEWLLRLYPRAWRRRYGAEFLGMLGNEPLQFQQIIDIVFGAIDARLSADVRGATRVAAQHPGGTAMVKSVSICERNQTRYTTRDGVIGAIVMVTASVVFALLGIAARRQGWTWTADALLNTGFFAALLLSMPFWLTKGQPWKAQAVIIIATILMLLIVISLGPST